MKISTYESTVSELETSDYDFITVRTDEDGDFTIQMDKEVCFTPTCLKELAEFLLEKANAGLNKENEVKNIDGVEYVRKDAA